MSDETRASKPAVRLTVLPTSGRVESLRKEFAMDKENLDSTGLAAISSGAADSASSRPAGSRDVGSPDTAERSPEISNSAESLVNASATPASELSESPAGSHAAAFMNTPTSGAALDVEKKLLEGRIIEALCTVFDPEIPVSIYELGLIYHIEIDDQSNVQIRMTLTAPACPVAGTLPGEVEKKVGEVQGVKTSKVELVWEPPWQREMMSESAMLQLGF